ncbi:MAG: hypothetical protein M3Y45_00085 [Actinomycetota bacterium]|nr:hypothetical protein [Actinomycetota bacterium]
MSRSTLRIPALAASALTSVVLLLVLTGGPSVASGTDSTASRQEGPGPVADATPVGPTGNEGPNRTEEPTGPAAVAPTAGHPGAGKTRRARTRLKIRRAAWRGSTVSLRLSINSLASLPVQARLRLRTGDGRRTVLQFRIPTASAPVLRARIELPPESRPLRVTVRYPGDQQVRPQKATAAIPATGRAG